LDKVIKASDPEALYQHIIFNKFVTKFIYLYIKDDNLIFDENKFESLYVNLEEYIQGTAKFHYFANLYGFDHEEQEIVVGDDITIRKIVDTQKVMASVYNQLDQLLMNNNYDFQQINPSTSRIETYDIHYNLDSKREKFQHAIDVLNLFTEGPVQLSYVKCELPLFYPAEISSAVEVIKPRGGSGWSLSKMSKDESQKFTTFFEKLSNVRDRHKLGFAIRRFNYGKISRDRDDKIVDLIISLESLFGDGSNTDLNYKLALRVALIHGKDYHHRKKLRKIFKLLYDARSHVVHGSEADKTIRKIEQDCKDWMSNLMMISRNSIIAYLNLMGETNTVNDIIIQIDESIFDDVLKANIRTKARLEFEKEF